MFFGLSFGIAFYMGYVWTVYKVGMAYALISHEMCQEYMWNSRNVQGTSKGTCMECGWNMHGAIFARCCNLKRASRSHAKTGFIFRSFGFLFGIDFLGVFLEVAFSHFFRFLGAQGLQNMCFLGPF